GLVQVVAAGVADADMDALYFSFRLLPVTAEFGLAAHGLLRTAQRAFMPLETVERVQMGAIRERGEASNAHVDTHGCAGPRQRLLNLTFRLDRHEPLAARQAD